MPAPVADVAMPTAPSGRGGPGRGAAATGAAFWTVTDVGLLLAVLVASSDMLVQLSPLGPLVWLLCYGLTLVRIAMTFPWFLSLMMRNVVVLAFPAACLASVLWSMAPSDTLRAGVQLTMTVLIASYLGWRWSVTLILKCMVGVLSVGVALSLVHWATGIFPWPVYTNAGGLAGFFSHKNMLGQRALFCVVAIVAIWLMRPREAGPGFKALATLSFGAMLAALGLAESMTSVLLAPAFMGLMLLVTVHRVPPGLAFWLGGAVLVTAALGPVMLAVGGVDPVGAVLGAVGKDATLTGRTLLWDIAADIVAGHPVLGVGYAAFWAAPEFANARLQVFYAGATAPSFHNFVWEIRVAAGWPALLSMLALLAVAVARLWRLWRGAGTVAAAAGLVLVAAIVATSLVGASLYRQHEFMIVLLVMLCVSAGEELRRLRVRAD